MKRSTLLLLFVFHAMVGFAQLGEGQLKQIRGKVVDIDGKPVAQVDVLDARGNKVAVTDAKGSFLYNAFIPLGGSRPVFSFSKKGYLPHEWRYSSLDLPLTVTLKRDAPELVEEPEVVEEVAPREEKKAVSKTPNIQQVTPTVAGDKLPEKPKQPVLETVDNQGLIQNLVNQIDYLESLLLKENIPFDQSDSASANQFVLQNQRIDSLQTDLAEVRHELQETKTELKETKIELRHLWILFLLFLLIITPTILAIIFYRNNKKTKGLNEELKQQLETIHRQKEEISVQHDNIADKNRKLELAYSNIRSSILYAQKIQESILINPNELSEVFTDTFIYYKPKDIVSGDFYWFSVVQDKIILAAADCTGHGVPGAFMTMLGNSFLNEIVNKNRETDPAEILNQLHAKISENLRQSEEDSVKDGMDISLVSIDQVHKTVTFAGANNPFYYVQGDEILEIKATRRGIGGELVHRKPFQNTILDLTQVASFYLVSDGFQDQFDGTNDKKYKKRRFRELLGSISSLSAQVQKQRIDQEFSSWKGSNEQTDDVLVIGVKL